VLLLSLALAIRCHAQDNSGQFSEGLNGPGSGQAGPGHHADDLTPDELGTGIAFWWQNVPHHNCKLIAVSADGSTVTIQANDGKFAAPWAQLPADVTKRMQADYDTLLKQATKAADAGGEATPDPNTPVTLQGKVLQVAGGGILLDLDDQDEQVFIEKVTGVAIGAHIRLNAFPDGTVKGTTASGAVMTVQKYTPAERD
jgi:hypothetical protein